MRIHKRVHKQFVKSISLTALLFTGLVAGGFAQDANNNLNSEADAPVIVTKTPADGDVNVDLNSEIEITFSTEMDEATINGTTLLLHATFSEAMYEGHGDEMDDHQRDQSDRDSEDYEDSEQLTSGYVDGTVSYSNKVAVFTPDMELREDATYTFTVTDGVESAENVALESDQNWSFTTIGSSHSTYSDELNVDDQKDHNGKDDMAGKEYDREREDDMASREDDMASREDDMEYSESTEDSMQNGKKARVDLGKASQFVILARTDIKNESESRITGNTGEGSAADSKEREKDTSDSDDQTADDQTADDQATDDQTAEMQMRESDDASADVSEAIEDMMAAYSNASMQNDDEVTSHMNERFHDTELTPGTHEWSDSLHLDSDVTLSGNEDDVWIIKVNGNLIVDEDVELTLSDGARSDNVYWLVEGEVTVGENAQFEGIILSTSDITLRKGAKLNGRMFSQASISLDDNTVTEPTTMDGRATTTN